MIINPRENSVMAKKKCSGKCSKKSCGSKNTTKKCNNKSPETLESKDIVLQPKSKANYFYGLIKKAFGYD